MPNEVTVWIRARNATQAALRQAQAGFGKFAATVKRYALGIGAALGVGIAGIAAMGKALIKSASDAAETRGKFEVVFRAVRSESAAAAKDLQENFGLSRKSAQQLLSDTGDLLSGFGFTGAAALDLSTKVNKLAVDLASFTNFSGGAKGASEALTKALLGERESVKALGIAILEKDVIAKVAEMTARGVTFETERQAKAYATLELALTQSANAEGDFERTQSGLANQWRIFTAHMSDFASHLGTAVIEGGRLAEVLEDINTEIDKMGEGKSKGQKLAEMLTTIADKGRLINLGPVGESVKRVFQFRAAAKAVTHDTAESEIEASTASLIARAQAESDARRDARAQAEEQAAQKEALDRIAAAEHAAKYEKRIKAQALAEFEAETKRFHADELKRDAKLKQSAQDVADAKKTALNEVAAAANKARDAEFAALAQEAQDVRKARAAKLAAAGANVAQFIANRKAGGAFADDDADFARAKALENKLKKAGGGGEERFLNKRDRNFLEAHKQRKRILDDAEIDRQHLKGIKLKEDMLKADQERENVKTREHIKNLSEKADALLVVGGTL